MGACLHDGPEETGRLKSVLDFLTPAAFLGCAILGTHVLCRVASSPLMWVSVPVGILAAAAAVLERLRPEQATYRKLDLPLSSEAGHFLLNYQLGYALALAACRAIAALLEASSAPSLWFSGLPTALQVALALLVAEGVSYWQHRLSHRIPFLWRCHALHHSGARLNLVRAGRFHFVDVGAGAFCTFAPLVLLRTPEAIVTWTASLQGVLGVLQHANMRVRTPRWVDRVICTPAVHRYHHSIDVGESDGNFGTTFMVFDRLFRTYVEPGVRGPVGMGIANDPVPSGFWSQYVSPFRRVR